MSHTIYDCYRWVHVKPLGRQCLSEHVSYWQWLNTAQVPNTWSNRNISENWWCNHSTTDTKIWLFSNNTIWNVNQDRIKLIIIRMSKWRKRELFTCPVWAWRCTCLHTIHCVHSPGIHTRQEITCLHWAVSPLIKKMTQHQNKYTNVTTHIIIWLAPWGPGITGPRYDLTGTLKALKSELPVQVWSGGWHQSYRSRYDLTGGPGMIRVLWL